MPGEPLATRPGHVDDPRRAMSGYEVTPWTWALSASALFMAALGIYVWRRRETPAAVPLSLAAFLLTAWCLAGAAEISSIDHAAQQRWFLVGDFLTMPAAVLGLWFALAYAGLTRWLTRPVVAVLVGSVVALGALYLVDDGRLMWTRLWWDGGVRGDVGPVGALFGMFGFGLILLATLVFAFLFVRSPAHRVPVALILVGQVTTRVAYPLSALNIAYLPGVPLLALAFVFQMFLYGVALYRFGLFDVVPAARTTIIEQMPDAMLVLDARGRLADLNDAAARLLGVARPRAVGRSLSALPGAAALSALILDGSDDDEEMSIGEGAGARRYQVTSTPLSNWQGRTIGRLVMLHDITALRTAEQRLIEQERSLAGAREREQVARELHDGLGQVLGYVSIQADAARKLLADAKVPAAEAHLGRLAEVAREGHADVRGYITELHSAPATPRPFLAALRQYVDGFARHYGVETDLAIDPALDEEAFRPDEQLQLLRIAQEAVGNARRHAHATRINIALTAHDGHVRLAIGDDGCGFDVVAASGSVSGDGRYGLLFMRERAKQIGARFAIDSAPGRGTHVIVDIPRTVATDDAGPRPIAASEEQPVLAPEPVTGSTASAAAGSA